MRLKSNSGFTLVELLVAMGVGAIILTGAYLAFQTQHRSYVVQDQVAAMQQNLRSAMYLITRDLQMAGWYSNFDRTSRTIPPEETGGLPALAGRPLLFSVDNYAAGDGVIRDGTDAIVIVRAGGEPEVLGGGDLAGNASISIGNLTDVVSSYGLLVKDDLRTADLFRLGETPNLGEHYFEGDLLFRADVIIYRIQMVNGRPVLQRRNLGNDNGYQTVAEDIDNMQIRYQLSNGLWQDQINTDSTNHSGNVRAVEVTLVGRTALRQRGYTDTNTYNFANNPAPHLNPNDNFRRKVFTTTVKTRNVGL